MQSVTKKTISVKVVPYSRQECVEILSEDKLIVRVNAIPSDGAANERVIELLAKYFKLAKSKIHLIRGRKSKNKTFEI